MEYAPFLGNVQHIPSISTILDQMEKRKKKREQKVSWGNLQEVWAIFKGDHFVSHQHSFPSSIYPSFFSFSFSLMHHIPAKYFIPLRCK